MVDIRAAKELEATNRAVKAQAEAVAKAAADEKAKKVKQAKEIRDSNEREKKLKKAIEDRGIDL